MAEQHENEARPALTRRKFLQGIAFSAAALAVNQVIAACAPAAPTSAPAAPTSAPAAATSAPAAATSAPGRGDECAGRGADGRQGNQQSDLGDQHG